MEHRGSGGLCESKPDQCGLARTVPKCVTDKCSFSGDDAGNGMPTAA